MQIRQFYKIFESGHVPISPATFQIAHKWRPIDWGENLIGATDCDGPLWIARKLGKLAWGFGAECPNPLGVGTDDVTFDAGA
jgi:hypothetical protein